MSYESLARAVREGDVVFGLQSPLLEAIESIDVQRHRKIRRFYFGVFPGRSSEKATAILQADLTNSVWDHEKPNNYSSIKNVKNKLINASRGLSFRNFLATHERYDVASQFQNVYFDSGNKMDIRKAWGRTSKAGLEFQFTLGGAIHFILTDISLNEVATKTGRGGDGFVTAKELRWLYRHRNVPQIQNQLHFWYADRQAPQSEIWAQPAWRHYQPKNHPIDLKRTEAPAPRVSPNAPEVDLNLGDPFKFDF